MLCIHSPYFVGIHPSFFCVRVASTSTALSAAVLVHSTVYYAYLDSMYAVRSSDSTVPLDLRRWIQTNLPTRPNDTQAMHSKQPTEAGHQPWLADTGRRRRAPLWIAANCLSPSRFTCTRFSAKLAVSMASTPAPPEYISHGRAALYSASHPWVLVLLSSDTFQTRACFFLSFLTPTLSPSPPPSFIRSACRCLHSLSVDLHLRPFTSSSPPPQGRPLNLFPVLARLGSHTQLLIPALPDTALRRTLTACL